MLLIWQIGLKAITQAKSLIRHPYRGKYSFPLPSGLFGNTGTKCVLKMLPQISPFTNLALTKPWSISTV